MGDDEGEAERHRLDPGGVLHGQHGHGHEPEPEQEMLLEPEARAPRQQVLPKAAGDEEAVPAPAAANRAYLGVGGSQVPELLGEHLKLEPGHGVVVRSLDPAGPAAKAGLVQNDVITKVGGKPVGSHDGLREAVSAMKPGDEVVAVGFPFGMGPSVSYGVISGLNREFRSPEGERLLTRLIQFDAAANFGNSGGPLVTMQGDVVGIVTAIMNPTESGTFIGIGFAVTIAAAGRAVGMHPF